MIEIARHANNNGIFQKDIAKNQGLSVKYLDHIIPPLKAAGLISNVKGKKSGYILARNPDQITVFDIHKAFEPGICVIDCLAENFKCDRMEGCSARGFWGDLNNQVVEYFKNTSLSDLAEKHVNPEDNFA